MHQTTSPLHITSICTPNMNPVRFFPIGHLPSNQHSLPDVIRRDSQTSKYADNKFQHRLTTPNQFNTNLNNSDRNNFSMFSRADDTQYRTQLRPLSNVNSASVFQIHPSINHMREPTNFVKFKNIILDNNTLPCFFRDGEYFVSVRMVEIKFLSRYPNTYPDEIKAKPPLKSYTISPAESRFLEHLNYTNKFEYGIESFDRDNIVNVKDFVRFYNTVKDYYALGENEMKDEDYLSWNLHNERLSGIHGNKCVTPLALGDGNKPDGKSDVNENHNNVKSLNTEDGSRLLESLLSKDSNKSQSVGTNDIHGGWLQMNNTLMPYVIRQEDIYGQQEKFVPVEILQSAAGFELNYDDFSVPATESECHVLNKNCQLAGFSFIFDNNTLLASIRVVMRFVSRVIVKELPSQDPLFHAVYENAGKRKDMTSDILPSNKPNTAPLCVSPYNTSQKLPPIDHSRGLTAMLPNPVFCGIESHNAPYIGSEPFHKSLWPTILCAPDQPTVRADDTGVSLVDKETRNIKNDAEKQIGESIQIQDPIFNHTGSYSPKSSKGTYKLSLPKLSDSAINKGNGFDEKLKYSNKQQYVSLSNPNTVQQTDLHENSNSLFADTESAPCGTDTSTIYCSNSDQMNYLQADKPCSSKVVKASTNTIGKTFLPPPPPLLNTKNPPPLIMINPNQAIGRVPLNCSLPRPPPLIRYPCSNNMSIGASRFIHNLQAMTNSIHDSSPCCNKPNLSYYNPCCVPSSTNFLMNTSDINYQRHDRSVVMYLSNLQKADVVHKHDKSNSKTSKLLETGLSKKKSKGVQTNKTETVHKSLAYIQSLPVQAVGLSETNQLNTDSTALPNNNANIGQKKSHTNNQTDVRDNFSDKNSINCAPSTRVKDTSHISESFPESTLIISESKQILAANCLHSSLKQLKMLTDINVIMDKPQHQSENLSDMSALPQLFEIPTNCIDQNADPTNMDLENERCTGPPSQNDEIQKSTNADSKIKMVRVKGKTVPCVKRINCGNQYYTPLEILVEVFYPHIPLEEFGNVLHDVLGIEITECSENESKHFSKYLIKSKKLVSTKTFKSSFLQLNFMFQRNQQSSQQHSKQKSSKKPKITERKHKFVAAKLGKHKKKKVVKMTKELKVVMCDIMKDKSVANLDCKICAKLYDL